MYVCSVIISAPCSESARDAPCQLRDSGAMFLAGCRSSSCLAAEKRDVLRQFSAGRHAIFKIIGRPFRYRSLAYLIRAIPVKGAAKESAFFFPWAKTPFFIIFVSRTFGYRRTYSLSANVRIKLYRRCSSQPPLLPVQIVQNWQSTDSLACDKLEPARRACIQLVLL